MVSYNEELLNQLKEEYKLINVTYEIKNDNNNKTGPKSRGINRDTRIKGNCMNENCTDQYYKTFRDLYEKKCFLCKKCSKICANSKREETCIEKYGQKHVSQVQDFKDKIEKTNIEKYGGKSPMSSDDVKNKIKSTFIEKYGVDHTHKIPEVINKMKNTRKENLGIENFKYSKESLEEYCKNINVILLNNEYLETDINFYNNITREDFIYFKCINDNCNNNGCKTLRQIFDVSNAYCEDCTTNNMINKCKETYFNNTGFEHPMKNPEHLQIVTEKLREIHNDPDKSESIRKKTKETNLINNGVEYPQQSENIRKKTIETNIEKFGVEHPCQNTEIAEKASKNAYLKKEFVFPSGRIDEVQGTEIYALDYLINIENINEDDIVTKRKDVPEIWYTDEEGTKHRHYVDIFIKSQNRCIESKSTYTYEKNEDKVLKKKEASLSQGYLYEIWVYDQKGIRINVL